MKRSSNCQKFVLALVIVLFLGIICIAGCGKKDEKDTENFIPVKDRIAVFDMDGTLLAFGNSGSDTSMMNFKMNISRMMLHNLKLLLTLTAYYANCAISSENMNKLLIFRKMYNILPLKELKYCYAIHIFSLTFFITSGEKI